MKIPTLTGGDESDIQPDFRIRERQAGQVKMESEDTTSLRAWRFICRRNEVFRSQGEASEKLK